MLPLAVPAVVFFLQFVLIGAGKPAEYGRFGIFTNTALAIGSACLLTRRWTKLREIVNWVPVGFVLIWLGWHGALYIRNFQHDARGRGSRIVAIAFDHIRSSAGGDRRWLLPNKVAVIAEPAPYCCPPLRFHGSGILLFQSYASALAYRESHPEVAAVIRHLDVRRSPPFAHILRSFPYYATHPRAWLRLGETPISWANKPFEIDERGVANGYRLTIP